MGVLEGCNAVIKYIFFFFTFVFWILGIAAMGVGIWALVDKGFEEFFNLNIPELDAKALQSAGILLIIVGVMVMIIGFLGCWGAAKENQCFLGLFSLLLFLIFALMVAGAVLAYGYEDVLGNILKKGLKQLKDDYNKSDHVARDSLDKIQEDFKCCVFEKDENPPPSCFNGTTVTTSAPATTVAPTGNPVTGGTTGNPVTGGTTGNPATGGSTGNPVTAAARVEENKVFYDEKCYDAIFSKMTKALDQYKGQIAGIGVASAIIVILGIIVSLSLCCKIRRGYQGV